MEDGLIVEEGPPAKIFGCAENARTREFCSKVMELYTDNR
jgi:ABC-type histidine transport system ATPase subunit